MKSLLFLVIFLSANAFAGGELLKKFARTGRVAPEDSYVKECTISQNGIVSISIQLADGVPLRLAKRISPHVVHEIRALVHFARNGEILEEPYPCDAGTNTLEGFIGSNQVELDLAVNCRSHRVNQTPVLPRLKLISTQQCGF